MSTRATMSTFGRYGALTALTVGLTATALGAVPTAASAACGSGVGGGYLGSGWVSVQLRSKANCAMYARLTIDDATASVGFNFKWRVERQVNGTYGWLTTDTKNASTYGGFEGSRDTATVPNSTTVDDRFRACSDFGTGSWRCTSWIEA